jgi:hypothetical protein
MTQINIKGTLQVIHTCIHNAMNALCMFHFNAMSSIHCYHYYSSL